MLDGYTGGMQGPQGACTLYVYGVLHRGDLEKLKKYDKLMSERGKYHANFLSCNCNGNAMQSSVCRRY